ncbi:hypothetical protein PF005_g5222 [Phytophthora fragariae]|uniref:REJ domain-containing protein n=1 Tax=Phytophthora fragariae TaxID=53985 RepID=A0A6A4EEK3_9STRA|nr:hypothetical protein PF003_g2704 [Phytophthora fragariae]KAE8944771.1 hypothetical protein PF009_g5554 [Phytophthora fragariae]KAE9128507.1 hypothetical protein PF007_g5231 [Phytophthora fragariae]KAE9151352.1 hypothetical protein PF006_g4347 [Phytophthora fragariae]KAE9226175.1 hypothetical protein PF005_g5222 [Phytophthora fragariae]
MATRCTGVSLAAYTLSASTILPSPSPSPSFSSSLSSPSSSPPSSLPPPPATALGESSCLRVVDSTGVSLG